MYRKSWRYYRDSALLWLLFILMVVTAGYALKHPIYWIAVLLIWFVRNPIRNAFFFCTPLPTVRLDAGKQSEFSRADVQIAGWANLVRTFPAREKSRYHPPDSSVGQLRQQHADLRGIPCQRGIRRFHDRSTRPRKQRQRYIHVWFARGRRRRGAVDYLLSRLDVNGQKIGALGISLGAQAALRGALKTDCLRALVLEGLGPVRLSDHGGIPKSLRRWINYPFNWIYYHAYEFMIGGHDTSVMEAIRQVRRTDPFNCQRRKGYLFQPAFFPNRE